MAVHIRLSRVGAKKAPVYRVIVADQRSPREGRFIEKIGSYDPTANPVTLVVNRERLDYWRARGAQASHTVERLLRQKTEVVLASPVQTPKAAGAGKPS